MKYSRSIKFFILMLTILGLTSCSVFGPVKSDPPKSYVIKADILKSNRKPLRFVSLFVAPVESDSIYNTTQMAYSTKPYQISYFAKNQWAETPAQMLQAAIVQGLNNKHYFRIVNSVGVGRYHYILNGQLLELKQEFYDRMSLVSLKFRVQLIRGSNNRIIAVKEFSVKEWAPQANPYGGVIAANRATTKLVNQIAKFCLQQI